MEAYIRALEKEIAKRRQVVELLTQGKKYYDSLQGEAEIVATVRKEFSHFYLRRFGFSESQVYYRVVLMVWHKLSIQGLCNSHTGPESRVGARPPAPPCICVFFQFCESSKEGQNNQASTQKIFV